MSQKPDKDGPGKFWPHKLLKHPEQTKTARELGARVAEHADEFLVIIRRGNRLEWTYSDQTWANGAMVEVGEIWAARLHWGQKPEET